jgi:phenylacetate-CoA ligase
MPLYVAKLLRKFLFFFVHLLYDMRFLTVFRIVGKSQWQNVKSLKKEQEEKLRKIIRFSYNNVPYYRKLFESMNLSPDNIRSIEDLQRLSILTKDIIKKNWDQFVPLNIENINFINKATGGTTGTPLEYRITRFEQILLWAIQYHSWRRCGYELGDRVLILGGTSLLPSKRYGFKKFIYKILRNFVYMSAFDMGDKDMTRYITVINRNKPKIGYGYPSAWYLLAKYIKRNKLQIHSPNAIFTTAEKLYSSMRKEIEYVFNCEVYDSYGLNDGGISACECSQHSGLHINTERSIVEVVDENGNQLEKGEGRILATSLYNYAMPFIRYETGDIGSVLPEDEMCRCGRGYRRLGEILGRSVDILVTPEGKKIHGWFFLYIFWEYCKGIKEYQVVQEKVDKIIVKIIKEKDFDKKQLDIIREIVRERSEGWKVEFEFVEQIERTESNKFKFIVNKLE